VVLGIVLVLVLLYLASLGVGLSRDDGRRSLSDATAGVASALEGMLAGFAPRLDGSRLYCNQQRMDRAFSLNGDGANCNVDIKVVKPIEKYRKATLAVAQADPALTVYVRSTKKDAAKNRDITGDCNNEAIEPRRLEIIYKPDGEDGGDCWIKQELTAKEHRAGKTMPEVGIVVLTDPEDPKGATLTLRHVCQGCSAAQAKLQLILQ
jgi:hypothetical protein